MPVSFAALMCHAPIVVPEVGGADARHCRATTRAMTEVAARAVAHAPDQLVLLSPHAPRHRTSFGVVRPPYRGDLGRFRAPEVRVDLPAAPIRLDLPEVAHPEGLSADHGALVPLSFLWKAGWRGPTAILSLPWDDDPDTHGLGATLAALPGRTAVIASGDMSHRLKPGAPAGFHPEAHQFDEAFVAALRAHDWGAVDGALPAREVAAEDVVVSARVALAAAGHPHHDEVLAYEGPWGVGYTEAILYDDDPPPYAVARRALTAAVRGERARIPPGGPPSGVFVTLHHDGRLRGCVGHTSPTTGSLHDEITEVAPLAALSDPRFPPVTPDELDTLDIEVSVLSPPEPIADLQGHDPRRHGLVVSAAGRRGLLLPDLDGVDTAEQQLAICKRKGRIPDGVPVSLERFTVTKHAAPRLS